jgi:hypothetical protein
MDMTGRQYDYIGPTLLPDWPERVRKGEYALPLYADLPSMPEMERKVIWRLMLAQEGMCLIPIYRNFYPGWF